jgi:hypothetical protein
MSNFDQNSSYIHPLFAVFAQTLVGQFPQNVGFCTDFFYIAHLGIPEIWAIARKDEFAQKLIFRCRVFPRMFCLLVCLFACRYAPLQHGTERGVGLRRGLHPHYNSFNS